MRLRMFCTICLFLLLSISDVWAKKEGELKDLQNPGFVEPPSWFKTSFLDLNEDIAEAAAEGRRLLLYFYQDGCPYCKKLITVNFAQKAIEDKTRQNFDVVAINMWGDREVTDFEGNSITEKKLAENFRVMFTPTMLFLNEKGQVALRINGYFPPFRFGSALDYVAGKHENTLRFRDYFKQQNPTPSVGELHSKPYFMPSPLNLSKINKDYFLVLFEQKECPACDELHTDVLQRKETKDLINRFDVAQVDMWSNDEIIAPSGEKTTATKWAKSLDIKYAPTFVFFNKQGKEVIRMEAYLKSFHVQSVLDYVSTAAYQKEPSFQRYIDERAEAIRAKGITVDLMN